MSDYATSIFTDGSKTEAGTVSCVFSDDLGTSVSLRLPNICTVFQAEIQSIWLQGNLDSFPFVFRLLIYMYVDSLATINALNSYVIKSKCVDCIKSLNLISYH